MWTTLCQIGELVRLSQQVYSAEETRVFVTYASPAQHGLIAQLATHLKVLDQMSCFPCIPATQYIFQKPHFCPHHPRPLLNFRATSFSHTS